MLRAVAVLVAVAPASLAGCAGGAMTLYEENDDLLPSHGRDANYTQGARLSRVFPSDQAPELTRAISDLSPFYDKAEINAVGFVVGQNMYTPRNTEVPRLLKRDRPYAGWLYAGMVVATQKIGGPERAGDDQQSLEIDVGVIGDDSQARTVQSKFHELTGAGKSQGWANQLDFEPGLVATYERRHRILDVPLFGGIGADLIPTYGASVGNVDTHIEAEFTGRFGFELPRDFGVNTISTTAMETSSSGKGGATSIYLFGSAEGRGVAQNIFLDGNTWRDSHSVDSHPYVAEFRGGIALQYKALRLTYTMITVSEEHEFQHGWTRYGSLSLGLFLDF